MKQILDEEAAKREAELNLQEAKQKAKQKGWQEGRREGREEGKQEEQETIARRLLEKGMEIDFVTDATGLTKDSVIDIQRNMQR